MSLEMIQKLKKMMEGREIYTPKELVRLGIFGSTSSVHRAVKKKQIKGMVLVGRRLVVFKDSIFEHLQGKLK